MYIVLSVSLSPCGFLPAIFSPICFFMCCNSYLIAPFSLGKLSSFVLNYQFSWASVVRNRVLIGKKQRFEHLLLLARRRSLKTHRSWSSNHMKKRHAWKKHSAFSFQITEDQFDVEDTSYSKRPPDFYRELENAWENRTRKWDGLDVPTTWHHQKTNQKA